MNFLVDNQLPPALARPIQAEFGVEAMHVADIGFRNATDIEIWAYASSTGSVLISKGEDFVSMVSSASGAGLIWVRIGNCRRGFLMDVFRRVWPRIITRLNDRDRFVEIP